MGKSYPLRHFPIKLGPLSPIVRRSGPGFAQDLRPSQADDSRRPLMLIAQQPTAPTTAPPKRKWEYYVASFYYKSGKPDFFGIGAKKSEWIFELDDKKASLREGLAELGNLGYELVGIDPSSSSGHSDALYIFKREVEMP
jgi:hypothetical protein